ncbi:MAG TPA: carboxylesterase family protein, partial [Mycobacterium sp.]
MPIRSSRRRRAWAALLVTAVMAAACGQGALVAPRKAESPYAGPLDAGVVRTAMGSVRGQVASDYRLFQSIPYAAPPVGPLRWQLPRPAARWSGMLDATKAGPQCMQDTGPNPRVGKPTSENCLTLN